MTLLWTTYQDASDPCRHARIRGDIHPPADDTPGRLIGGQIGVAVLDLADSYFFGIR
jgi:hypothetical protein